MVDVSIQKRPHNAEGDEIQVKFPTVSTLETGNTENELVMIAQDGNNAIMPKMLDFMLKKLDEMFNQEGNTTSIHRYPFYFQRKHITSLASNHTTNDTRKYTLLYKTECPVFRLPLLFKKCPK